MFRNRCYIIYIVLYIILRIQRCFCQNNEITDYSMDTFDENDNFISRYRLEFNYTTYLFNDFEEIKFMLAITYIIMLKKKINN
ncbi:hypothetical protein LY90DRAFT_128422 [Neocallimastix californiae]|uniref:Uncharacterized protein n=1 Tax=Neocallimastix californiae TaxID=1754190 RepID=A0A1Y2AJR6_9FUNG|nr:hypothetical protein LY90DRAFT_128422 [Neocallimastix californiae]|eukprot:ORY22809.1 hypothetical protein LY90DRAFT_128422 [Neocallimastix californiae]